MEPLMDNKTFTYVKMFAKVWLQTCKWIWFRQRYDYQLEMRCETYGDIHRMGALQKTYGILHQNHPKNFSVLPASARERDATFINHAFPPNSYGWNESSSALALSAHARSQKSGQHSGCGSWNPGLNLALGISAPELLSLESYTYIHTKWNIYWIYWVCITMYIYIYMHTHTYWQKHALVYVNMYILLEWWKHITECNCIDCGCMLPLHRNTSNISMANGEHGQVAPLWFRKKRNSPAVEQNGSCSFLELWMCIYIHV